MGGNVFDHAAHLIIFFPVGSDDFADGVVGGFPGWAKVFVRHGFGNHYRMVAYKGRLRITSQKRKAENLKKSSFGIYRISLFDEVFIAVAKQRHVIVSS